MTKIPDLRPSATASTGGRFASGREYDANGHYVHGPRLKPQPIARMIADTIGPPGALRPDVARSQMRIARRRALLSLMRRPAAA